MNSDELIQHQYVEELEAENARLLAALREIEGSGPVAEDIRGHRDRLQRIARAAISEVDGAE